MLYSHATIAVVCLAVGWLAGVAYARTLRAWRDYTTHKGQTPILRSLSYRATLKAVGSVALAATMTAYALHILIAKGP